MSDVGGLDRSTHDDRTPEGAKVAVGEHLPSVGTTRTGQRVSYIGLSPRQVPKAWLQGLKDAGVNGVKVAQVHLGGGKYKTLPLVVQFDCPFDHVDDAGESWAKVRLKVNPYTGWVSIHEDSCRRCTQQQIEAWLITCPRCARGEDLAEHPDHDVWVAFYRPDGDESPIAFVEEAMHQFLCADELVEDTPGRRGGDWTTEAARRWLDNLVNEDGSHVVPVSASQREAWRLVKEVPGHPPQRFVYPAQGERGT